MSPPIRAQNQARRNRPVGHSSFLDLEALRRKISTLDRFSVESAKLLSNCPPSLVLPRIFLKLGFLCVFGFALVAETSFVYGQSTLIPVATRRGMVFDHAGNYLYISTSDGFVKGFNLNTTRACHYFFHTQHTAEASIATPAIPTR
jgi:hypothetical protein